MPQGGDLKNPERLIEAIAAHSDREAFAALFQYFAPRIKSLLVRSGSTPDVAEDVAHEAMIAVWRKAALFDAARAGAATWIFTIARNLRIDLARRTRDVPAETLYEVLALDEPPQPDARVLAEERDIKVRDAMRGLSDDQAKAVRLSFFEDKAHAEIARILDWPLGTVKSRLRQAMTKLRERLEDLA